MTIPSISWDETSPAGTDNIAQGDDRIRELKAQIREVVDVDHQFNSSGQDAANGQHVQVTLQEQANLGTGAVNATILGSQTVSGKGELVYTDEDDNDVQITDTGSLNAAALGGVYAVDDLAAVANIMGHVYPVGCIYTNITGTNPATELGIGTWVAFGAGRVPVGYDSGDTDFDTAEETGGAKTFDNSHDHGGTTSGSIERGADSTITFNTNLSHHQHDISSAGSATQTIVQPYIVVHFFKRTV